MINDTEVIAQAIQLIPDARTTASDQCVIVLRYPFTIQIKEPIVLFSEVMLRFVKRPLGGGLLEWQPVCIRVHDSPAKDSDMYFLPPVKETIYHTFDRAMNAWPAMTS